MFCCRTPNSQRATISYFGLKLIETGSRVLAFVKRFFGDISFTRVKTFSNKKKIGNIRLTCVAQKRFDYVLILHC